MTKGPFGPDEVAMTSFSGREEISRLFNFRLEFISTELDLKPGKIVGKEVNIEIDRRDTDGKPLTPRTFHGYINRFAAGPVALEETGKYKYRHYRAEMVPWLWFLTQTSRCFLFFPEKEDKTIFEVVQAVFDRTKSDLHVDPVNDLNGISDLKKRKVKHCVQYRESDFNFVSRTLEHYGAFYYFKFEDGKHTLVVDMKKNYPKCEEAEVSYPGLTGSHTPVDHITDWQHDYEFVSGKWTHTDYNFEKPSTSLKADAPKLPAIDLAQNDKYEIYDYPGEYSEKSDGQSDAKIRQEEEEVQHNVVNGTSLCRTFTPGHKFKLMNHPDEDAVSEHKISYVLTSVEHTASQPGADTGLQGHSEYTNRFTCIPESVQFRPARITPKPVISGVQTAVVVGPEEIHTDKYGRVKVQFHWDREGKKDGNSSAWIRVSQNWGGKEWGGMFIPHFGQEVIVEFLEGDPDQPIVTGRVYNAEQVVPLPLPAEKTKSIIRDYGNNQLIMEGKPGEQFIHLQQECGNELLLNGMKGEESIQLRDKFGNELFMNAVDGTIRLASPSHDSTLILGKSIFRRCSSNDSSFTQGSTLNCHAGLKHDVYMGMRSQTDLGSYIESMAGLKSTCILGTEVNVRVGYTINFQNAKQVTLNKHDYVQHSIGRLKIDSEAEVGIVGGPGDSARAQFGPGGLCLSYKNAGGPGRPAVSNAGIAAAAAGLIAAAAQVGAGVGLGICKANLDSNTTSSAKAWSDNSLGMYGGAAAAAAGAAGSFAAMVYGGNTSDTDDWSDGEAEAKVNLTSKGLKLSGPRGENFMEIKKDKIDLHGTGDIVFTNWGSDIRFHKLAQVGHQQFKWTQCKLDHANLAVAK